MGMWRGTAHLAALRSRLNGTSGSGLSLQRRSGGSTLVNTGAVFCWRVPGHAVALCRRDWTQSAHLPAPPCASEHAVVRARPPTGASNAARSGRRGRGSNETPRRTRQKRAWRPWRPTTPRRATSLLPKNLDKKKFVSPCCTEDDVDEALRVRILTTSRMCPFASSLRSRAGVGAGAGVETRIGPTP